MKDTQENQPINQQPPADSDRLYTTNTANQILPPLLFFSVLELNYPIATHNFHHKRKQETVSTVVISTLCALRKEKRQKFNFVRVFVTTRAFIALFHFYNSPSFLFFFVFLASFYSFSLQLIIQLLYPSLSDFRLSLSLFFLLSHRHHLFSFLLSCRRHSY